MNHFSLDNISVCINSVDILNAPLLHDLHQLIKKCDNYEPYYTVEKDADIIMFTAIHNGCLVGFLSLLLNDTDSTAEITALTDPSFRNKKIFSNLLSYAKEWLHSSISYKNYVLIGSISETLKASHFPYSDSLGIAFKEYMLKLTDKHYLMQSFIPSDIPDALSEAEFCFSDDSSEYLMYIDENASEPCAVLNLASEESFTNIYGVWVDPQLRGIGTGTLFFETFLEDYFDEYSLPLVLNVRSTNIPAFRLYKKCGFLEVSHISYYLFS